MAFLFALSVFFICVVAFLLALWLFYLRSVFFFVCVVAFLFVLWFFYLRCGFFFALPLWATVKKHMCSTNSSKICCSFSKNEIFEKSKMAAKGADMLWKRLLPWLQFLIKT